MKMYIWNNPYNLLNGGSIAYAVAADEDGARLQICEATIMAYGNVAKQLDLEGLHINRPADRILSIPCAEIYQWED